MEIGQRGHWVDGLGVGIRSYEVVLGHVDEIGLEVDDVVICDGHDE